MFSSTSESHFFYNGTVELRFDKENWVYYLVDPELGNLTSQNGVTSVIKIIDKSYALVPWAVKKAYEKLISLIPTYTNDFGYTMVPQMAFEEFNEIALKAKGAHREILDDASNVGHKAHKWLELYVQALMLKNLLEQERLLATKPDDPRATNCVNRALEWQIAHNVRYQKTEQRVYSKEHKYAGTLDGLALVDSCDNPKCCPVAFKDRLSLIDYKTSNALYIEYLFQTAAYCKAYMEEYNVNIEDRWVLRLGKEEGDFEPWHVTQETYKEDFRAFALCLELSNIVDSVNERMKEHKKRIKEIEKEEKKEAKAKIKAEAKTLKQQEKQRIKEENKLAKEEFKPFEIPKEK